MEEENADKKNDADLQSKNIALSQELEELEKQRRIRELEGYDLEDQLERQRNAELAASMRRNSMLELSLEEQQALADAEEERNLERIKALAIVNAAQQDALDSVAFEEASALEDSTQEREKSRVLARKILLSEKESRMELESSLLRQEAEERNVCHFIFLIKYF